MPMNALENFIVNCKRFLDRYVIPAVFPHLYSKNVAFLLQHHIEVLAKMRIFRPISPVFCIVLCKGVPSPFGDVVRDSYYSTPPFKSDS